MPRFYPVFLDLAGRLCLVVGGGAVAERKVAGLLEAGALVRVVSPDTTSGLRALAECGQIELCAEAFRPELLGGASLVFAATDSRSVNARVASEASALNLQVTVADSPEEGSFIVPAVVRRGEFCLAISTGGNNPMLAARVADELEARYGPDFGAFVELLGDVRDTIKEWTSDKSARRAAARAVLDSEAAVRAHLAAGRAGEAMDLARSLARQAIDEAEPSADGQ